MSNISIYQANSIVDDDPDITLTFKKGLEAENENSKGKIFFQVFTQNHPCWR